VPWMVYCGRHTVAYLNSMGFDTMTDVVQHRYDSMFENKTAAYGDKMVDFLFEGADAVEHMDVDSVSVRAERAAAANQSVLNRMKSSWPADFAAWWANTINLIV
jgi:hypothetical protein